MGSPRKGVMTVEAPVPCLRGRNDIELKVAPPSERGRIVVDIKPGWLVFRDADESTAAQSDAGGVDAK